MLLVEYCEGNDPEERYISFVFDVFKKFIYEEGEKYVGADFQKPEYLKTEGFEINNRKSKYFVCIKVTNLMYSLMADITLVSLLPRMC